MYSLQIPVTQIHSLRSSLVFLDLSEMDFDRIPNHAFHGLYSLETLLLNNLAFLTKIEAMAFHDLKHLGTLECQNNKYLAYIDPFAFFNNNMEEA